MLSMIIFYWDVLWHMLRILRFKHRLYLTSISQKCPINTISTKTDWRINIWGKDLINLDPNASSREGEM